MIDVDKVGPSSDFYQSSVITFVPVCVSTCYSDLACQVSVMVPNVKLRVRGWRVIVTISNTAVSEHDRTTGDQ